MVARKKSEERIEFKPIAVKIQIEKSTLILPTFKSQQYILTDFDKDDDQPIGYYLFIPRDDLKIYIEGFPYNIINYQKDNHIRVRVKNVDTRALSLEDNDIIGYFIKL